MKIAAVCIALLLTACRTSSSEQLTVNEVTLDYVVRGQGPPLYLLHGGMESRESYARQIPALARHFTVVALDSREQGRSSAAAAQITYERMAADVVALAAHLGHERISILGQSDGGVTALVAALRHPALVESLVLLGTNFHYAAYPPETRAFIANYRWDGSTDPEGFPGMFIEHYLRGHEDLSGFGEQLAEMAVMWTTSPELTVEDLATINARTLIINGDREDVPLAHVAEMQAAIGESELFVVPGTTHFLHQEEPDLVNGVIIEFLSR